MGEIPHGCATTTPATRHLQGREHPLVVVFYFPLVALPVAGGYCLFHGVPVQGMEWLWLLLASGLAQGAQICVKRAYQAERLATLTTLNYLGIFYALGLGFLFFGETMSVTSCLSVVLAGVVLNGWYTARQVPALTLTGHPDELGKRSPLIV